MAENIEEPNIEVAPKMAGSTKLIIGLGATVVILLILVAGGAGYLLSGGGGDSAANSPITEEGEALAAVETKEPTEEPTEEVDARTPIFVSLKPDFTANFKVGDQARFLQIAIDVMARDEAIIKKTESLMPMIRHRVVEILSRQDGTIYTAEGKDLLRKNILESLKEVVSDPSGTIEDVFFTSFVIQ